MKKRGGSLIVAACLVVAAACDDFSSTTPAPDAGLDGIVDAARPADKDATAPLEAAAPLEAGVDAGPCAACRSHFCDADGGCYPLAFVTGDVYHGDLDSDGGTKGIARANEICNAVGNAEQNVTGNFARG